ncbi:AMP-binding protein [Gordonia sp. (in: high G+C Gram-positive bacteria)]|uniref:AMP-binding protein n=1 Tax=Gordonia sp. (in: high G+C Gram-positive bacteria) TaxID=84139 RepID=UPI003C767157
MSVALGTTNVLVRRFDPQRTLELIAAHRCTTVVLVPTMLGRLLALGPDELGRHDTSSVSVIFCAGSALPIAVAEQAMKTFGPVVYNLYGASEVGVAAVATPADLRAAPGTVGRPPATAVVRLYDEDDRPIEEPDRTGTVYVGGLLSFAGYSGGGHKKSLDGLLSSGDIGHWDADGRLFIDGRDDDMIVSGGENVFPGEIDELLYAHPQIDEAAIVPVPDADFGQRLAAYVILRPDATIGAGDVRDYVRAGLSRYKVPREVVLVDELPRTPSGKLLRRNLIDPVNE